MPGLVVIPAGATNATLAITALTNSAGLNPETIALALADGANYLAASPNSATVSLFNLPPQTTNFSGAFPQGFTIQWASVPGFAYQVACKTNLSDPAWTELVGDIIAVSNNTFWTDTAAAGVTRRFYLVTAIDPDVVKLFLPAPNPISSGGVTFAWTSLPGQTYDVRFKKSLTDSNWTDLSGPIMATDTLASWTDFLTPAVPQRFYHIIEGQ